MSRRNFPISSLSVWVEDIMLLFIFYCLINRCDHCVEILLGKKNLVSVNNRGNLKCKTSCNQVKSRVQLKSTNYSVFPNSTKYNAKFPCFDATYPSLSFVNSIAPCVVKLMINFFRVVLTFTRAKDDRSQLRLTLRS